MIVKNEAENLPRLIASVSDCVDEIIITDTGSTDNTVEVAKQLGASVRHFEWVNDFAAARNESFSHVKTDYALWLDGDDVLQNKYGFKLWRDNVMSLADYWVAPYHYSSDASGNPTCTFARERVIRMDKGMRWRYFVHEGIIPVAGVKSQYTSAWSVKHMRTDADLVKDRSRNLKLFEPHKKTLDSRMKYYYGKELFEAGQPADAIYYLGEALGQMDLEMHDRMLAYQYISYSYMQCNQFQKALQIASEGVILDPHRAELWVVIGDCQAKINGAPHAIPAYSAAKSCLMGGQGGAPTAIFHSADAYSSYPRNQLARIYANIGDLDRAEIESGESADKFKNQEAESILAEVKRIKSASTGYKNAKPCGDIVISCPPSAPYLWDADIAKEKSMGGSETAAIEMAKWLHVKSGLPVKVFNVRAPFGAPDKVCDGVEYIDNQKIYDYFTKNRPKFHIAWRHNNKLTDAPTFVWSHDLQTQGVENFAGYDKVFCLTPFHKSYMMATQGVPDHKIHVTRNGINPDRFKDGPWEKDPYRFVFGSSPDRGLDRAMRVLDKVREKYPKVTLHIHYGWEHLDKYGLTELRVRLQQMVEERKDWVTYHGATQQDALMASYKQSSYNVQPSDWIETSCISAMELLACGVYPIFRRVGGVSDTLAGAERARMSTLVESDCITERQFQHYVDATIAALDENACKRVTVNVDSLSWARVADDWLRDIPRLIGELDAETA